MKKLIVITSVLVILLITAAIALHGLNNLTIVGQPQSWSIFLRCTAGGTKMYSYQLLDPNNGLRQQANVLSTKTFWNTMVKFTPDMNGTWVIKGESKKKVSGKWVTCSKASNNGYISFCGDAVVQGVEECDDGNIADGDGCNAVCHFEVCGNGYTDVGEQCDDGNTNNNDKCKNDCTNNICGDGILNYPYETCDDGNIANGDGCSSICVCESPCP